MNHQTYDPHPDLESIVKCYWTLEVPDGSQAPKQRILPDGCIEMCFILGDDIKRFTSETEFILQPKAFIIGQITAPYFVQPTGYVDSFAVRFYPYGFANFIQTPIKDLADKDTPLSQIFQTDVVSKLIQEVENASSTQERIAAVEKFLLDLLASSSIQDEILKSTTDVLYNTQGKASIHSILKDELSKRRKLERSFSKSVGISPKQLGRVIRLQAALKLMLNPKGQTLTQIAYESEYYDQAHFIKDFKDFTGVNPKEYLSDDQMMLSSVLYSKD